MKGYNPNTDDALADDYRGFIEIEKTEIPVGSVNLTDYVPSGLYRYFARPINVVHKNKFFSDEQLHQLSCLLNHYSMYVSLQDFVLTSLLFILNNYILSLEYLNNRISFEKISYNISLNKTYIKLSNLYSLLLNKHIKLFYITFKGTK